MSKKNIDELYKEQFKDFDEIPDSKVWKKIEHSLDKKKSRKVIPIWWKLGGAAAVLAALFYLINPFDKISNDTIKVAKQNNEPTKDTSEKNAIENSSTEEVQYSNADKQYNSDIEKTTIPQEDNLKNTPAYVKEDGTNIRSKKDSSTNNNTGTGQLKKSMPQPANNAIVSQEKNREDAYSNTDKKTEEFIKGNSALEAQKGQNTVAVNELEKENASSSTPEKTTKITQDSKLNKKTAENALAVNTGEEKKISEKAAAQKKSIFDEISDTNEEVVVENKENKWSVGPSVAPVYFNGMGEGSPISASFAPNSKSGDVNLSYGVSVAYEVSRKLKIRSGVYKVDYGYNTNDIEFTSSFGLNSTTQIANINYKNTANNIIVESIAADESKSNSPSFASDISAKSAVLEGSLSQQFGYIEVPLELNYAILEKRFGINVIGGVSSLFLINNDILLNSGDQTTEMGEANNINDINFSTNFGFGISYKITPKLLFNVEPLFKYQLNTFSNSAGSFQPFSVGVYSGVNFRF